MEIAKSAQGLGTNLDGYNAVAESECEKAMAEAGRVLRELSISAPYPCRPNPVGASSVTGRRSEQSVVSSRSAEPRAALLSAGRLRLDPDLDFVIHEEGAIELTEAGFRRMLQAHSAGFNAVIGIGSREVLRLPAPKLGHAPSADGSRQAIDPRCAELIEAHVRLTQPVSELRKAEELSEAALNMIKKERERREIESMLPWHAAGTLDRCDAECVERALAEDSELARRYELVREELAETIRVNEMLGAPSARAMEKLFAAIDAEEASATRTPLQRSSGTPKLATTAWMNPAALPVQRRCGVRPRRGSTRQALGGGKVPLYLPKDLRRAAVAVLAPALGQHVILPGAPISESAGFPQDNGRPAGWYRATISGSSAAMTNRKRLPPKYLKEREQCHEQGAVLSPRCSSG